MGHARALLSLDSAKEQIFLKERIIKRNMSVREIESFITRGKRAKKELSKKTVDIFKNRMEEELQKFLGTKVNIIKGRKEERLKLFFIMMRIWKG